MSGLEKGVTIFLGGLIAIATLNVLVAGKNNTPQVLSAAGGALSGSLAAAQGGA